MARPKTTEKHLMKNRNILIKWCVTKAEINQSDTAKIFRLPRNTVKDVVKK